METAKSLSLPAIRKDGARIAVEFTIAPFTNDSGQMIGIAAIMRDATTQFEELRALRRQLAVHPAALGPSAKIPDHDGTRLSNEGRRCEGRADPLRLSRAIDETSDRRYSECKPYHRR
jgi:hypothetical protein